MTPKERGQYSLGIEGAIAFHARNLVPLTTTVTAHPCYYALHAAASLPENPSSSDTAGELIRRLEVLLASASMLQARADMPGHDLARQLGEPHGFRAVGSALRGAEVAVGWSPSARPARPSLRPDGAMHTDTVAAR